MYTCLMSKKEIKDEISFEFIFYYGNGLNRIWNEEYTESNQNIYWTKNIDTFCPECASLLRDFRVQVASYNFKYSKEKIFANIINNKKEKNQNCHLCKEPIFGDYYGIFFDKIFVTGNCLENQVSHFISAYCLSCFSINHCTKSCLIGDFSYGLKINNKHKIESILSSTTGF